MLGHHTGAVTRTIVAAWLVAGAAADAVAHDPPAAAAATAADDTGGALFNPFAGASAPRAQARGPETERPRGDWTLPLVAATAGFAGIAVLMRKMVA
jgi:hypothetical protein